ncbi:TraB/GumN family protein [Candidatus Woesearchaeota archaeon]|nr:TraB/GumN family protein [Candidatus Woesearchaeota archaeon]
MRFKNIMLIGTSHIAKQSVQEVKRAIEEERPEIVALELDPKRLQALFSNKKGSRLTWKDIKKIGVKGWLFSIIGSWIEHKLGQKVGVAPGTEMLNAFKIAKKQGAEVALIDQDIEITLRKFSKALSWKEKWYFIVDIVKGLFGRTEITFDISKVPDEKLIHELLKKVKKRYPNLYRVLVLERNKVMARRLATLSAKFPEKNIVAVVGAGHESDIIELLKKYLNKRTDIII